MNKEYKEKLIKKYPLLYTKGKDRTPYNLFGFEVGNGWFGILSDLSSCINSYITTQIKWNDSKAFENVEVTQVKEKFGTLRFYTQGCDNHIDGLIQYAEHLSSITCEDCGSVGELRTNSGWHVTLCDEHNEERNRDNGI